jgi:hypothetical protein
MIRKKNRRTDGLAVQLILGLFVVGIGFFLFLVFDPVFNGLSETATEQANGSYYENDSTRLIEYMDVFSGTGLLVLPVLMIALFWIVRAILQTNT